MLWPHSTIAPITTPCTTTRIPRCTISLPHNVRPPSLLSYRLPFIVSFRKLSLTPNLCMFLPLPMFFSLYVQHLSSLKWTLGFFSYFFFFVQAFINVSLYLFFYIYSIHTELVAFSKFLPFASHRRDGHRLILYHSHPYLIKLWHRHRSPLQFHLDHLVRSIILCLFFH